MEKVPNRRQFLRGALTGSALVVAGCLDSQPETGSGTPGSESIPTSSGSGVTETDAVETAATDDESQSTADETTGSDTEALRSGGSSDVYPIANIAASYWSANRPATDTEYWPHAEYGIETDRNLADYWAGLYGFEPGEGGRPPFYFLAGLSNSETGLLKLGNGELDIGNSSASVENLRPDRGADETVTDHVVAADGLSPVISQAVADAGVTTITGQQVKDIYRGRITNWSELGGPDRDVQVLEAAMGSGARTSFVASMFGSADAETTVDDRYSPNQRLAEAVAAADNAISYLSLAFVDIDGVAPVTLEWDGTTYGYHGGEYGLDVTEYPLSRDLHMYTRDGTSRKEAAVINMILSEFGQETFVAANNYVRLSPSRRETQRNRLPDRDG